MVGHHKLNKSGLKIKIETITEHRKWHNMHDTAFPLQFFTD